MEKRILETPPGCDRQSQSIIVDGYQITLRFPERSNPRVMEGIREILSSAISTLEQPHYLQK